MARSPTSDSAGQPQFLTTDDGVRLRYVDRGQFNAGAGCVVFLHGWSANGRWFDRNVSISSEVRVVTMDYRGMGDSEHPGHGFRVSRLAADVRCLLSELNLDKVVLVGTSLGFTVIMNYIELFGTARVAGVAFVDQSACMYSKPGWTCGAPDLSNMALVASLDALLATDFPALADGIISSGFGETPPTDSEHEFFKREESACRRAARARAGGWRAARREHRPAPRPPRPARAQILKCDPRALGALMYHHANLDFRDLLPHVKVPVLNFVGGARARRAGGGRAMRARARAAHAPPAAPPPPGATKCHHPRGIEYIGEVCPRARNVTFEKSGHWLYWEEPQRFNAEILQFVKICYAVAGGAQDA